MVSMVILEFPYRLFPPRSWLEHLVVTFEDSQDPTLLVS